ncbi:hypothetical protein ACFY36_12550 [Actinoplanes sp. NPDC000266]
MKASAQFHDRAPSAAAAAPASGLHTEDEESGAVLEVVRYFNEQEAEQRDRSSAAGKAANMFGWHLDREVLNFLRLRERSWTSTSTT